MKVDVEELKIKYAEETRVSDEVSRRINCENNACDARLWCRSSEETHETSLSIRLYDTFTRHSKPREMAKPKVFNSGHRGSVLQSCWTCIKESRGVVYNARFRFEANQINEKSQSPKNLRLHPRNSLTKQE